MTLKYQFHVPDGYFNFGSDLIPKYEIAEHLKNKDEFVSDMNIQFAGTVDDECVLEYMENRAFGIDEREKIDKFKKQNQKQFGGKYLKVWNNFVVVIESIHNSVISIGSGTLAQTLMDKHEFGYDEFFFKCIPS